MKRIVWILAALFAIGCGEDVSVQKAAWDTFKGESEGKVTALRTALDGVKTKLAALPDFEGFDSLTALKTGLTAKVEALSTSIGSIEEAITTQGGAMADALKKRKISEADSALEAAKSAVNGAITSSESASEELAAAVTQLESYAGVVTKITEVKARASAEHHATESGTLDFLGIDFQTNSAEFDTSEGHESTEPLLAQMVAIVKECTESRFSIHGHASKEGNAQRNQVLSTQRAEAVKAHLLANGVPAEQITGVEGHGSSDSAVPEPEPDSEEANSMDPGLLEAIRNVNRRTSLKIETSCPAAG